MRLAADWFRATLFWTKASMRTWFWSYELVSSCALLFDGVIGSCEFDLADWMPLALPFGR